MPAVLRYRDEKGLSGKQLAKALNIAEGTVVKYVSFEACIPPFSKPWTRAKSGSRRFNEISKVPPDQQLELLQSRLSGTTRDELAEKLRRPKGKSKGKPQVRTKRIVCQLPSGVSIVATGQKLSLDEFVLALGQAQKAAKSARAEGLDARTFAAVMSSKAKVNAAKTLSSRLDSRQCVAWPRRNPHRIPRSWPHRTKRHASWNALSTF